MRILQVVPRYAPAWAFGGGVRMTYELARTWVAHGHEVTVFTSDQSSDSERFDKLEDTLDGIFIRRFRVPRGRLAAKYPFLFFRPAGLAAALAEQGRTCDVVHVAESRGPHNRWVNQHVAAQGVPVVWSAYGGLARGTGIRQFYRAAHDRVFNTAQIVRQARGLVAQTDHEAEAYRSFGADPARIRLIPLCVRWEDFATLPLRGRFRKKIGVQADQKLILFLGRIHATKGLQVLIPAFAEVARRDPQVHLAIVGWDHGFVGNAKRMVAQLGLTARVHFAGALYEKERFNAYVDADIFALTPGTYEETSLAALEACACGTGCVLTRQCEIPGLEAAGAGQIVGYEAAAVARALLAGLAANTSAEWGRNARTMVRTDFTTEIIATHHEKFFAEVQSGVSQCVSQ
jgi:glycosyltransferase involved in cell wall biosynthesis